MVKVLPTTFTLFESQGILIAETEPLCVYCSEQYVFIACEGCIIEAHDLSTHERVSRFRTIWPVAELVYNVQADCIVSLERRNQYSPAATRIYFTWKGIRELERPMRVICLDSPKTQRSEPGPAAYDVDAEILELPMENVSCLAVCQLTGTIAVGSEKSIRLFALHKDPAGSLSTGGYQISPFMDIRTDMKLKKLNICGQYIACTSTHRVRVLKFVILGAEHHPWSELQKYSYPTDICKGNTVGDVSYINDENFCRWSPSYVWETEAKVANTRWTSSSEPSSSLNNEALNIASENTTIQNDSFLNVGTLTLPAIANSSNGPKRDAAKHELEVVGPVEYVWGQPLSVSIHKPPNMKCWLLTMLYKRLPSSGFAYVHTSLFADSKEKASTGKRRSGTFHEETSINKRTRGGVHTIQLIPTFAKSDSLELIGMTCIFANRAKGYIYDVHMKTRLVTSLSFMNKSQRLSYDGQFLHSLSLDSDCVDSYTSRVGSSVLYNRPFVGGIINKHTSLWMNKPCPFPSLELTLISSNKFIGCTSLVSSSSYVVVLCKQTDNTVSVEPDKQQSFLQSLPFLRPKPHSSISWNIYVLQKKSVQAMFTQFRESAETLGQGIPPVLQHHLSEAHLLLRSMVIHNKSMDSFVELLEENCFQLADSFCLHLPDNVSVKNAAGYFVMSGKPISTVLQHITKKYTDSPTTIPFDILLSYLNMVLFEFENKITQHETLSPHGNEILELYTKYDCDHLPNLILYSWFEEFPKSKALDLLKLLLPRQTQSERLKNLIELAISYLLCELNRSEEASKKLSKLAESFLLSWANEHPLFLICDDKLTPLGQAMMAGSKECFSYVILFFLESKIITWQCVYNALEMFHESTLLTSQLVKQLLENILTDKTNFHLHEFKRNAAVVLAKLLFLRIVKACPQKSSSIEFGHRYMWLDKIPPFESIWKFCMTCMRLLTAIEDQSDSILYTSISQSKLLHLIELQSLLCSKYITHEIATLVNDMMNDFDSQEADGMTSVIISLQLLVLPVMNKLLEASKLILNTYPFILVEYCQCVFKSNLQLWKKLLEILIQDCNNTQFTTSVYMDVIDHVVTLTSPEEFCYLLPENGSVQFFLPAIEKSSKLFISLQITNNLHTIFD